jgi:DNA-binding XRE family transcriptional regulator
MHRCKCGGLMERSIRAEHVEDLGGVVVKILNAVGVLRCTECETEMVSIPDLDDLCRAAAISRALNPVRLAGREVKFFRRVLDMTQAEFAKAMDLAAAETVSRWENDMRGTGTACEKLTRHNVCALLSKMARGRPYDPADIAEMELVELPEDGELPPLLMVRVRLSAVDHHETDGWGEMARAA